MGGGGTVNRLDQVLKHKKKQRTSRRCQAWLCRPKPRFSVPLSLYQSIHVCFRSLATPCRALATFCWLLALAPNIMFKCIDWTALLLISHTTLRPIPLSSLPAGSRLRLRRRLLLLLLDTLLACGCVIWEKWILCMLDIDIPNKNGQFLHTCLSHLSTHPSILPFHPYPHSPNSQREASTIPNPHHSRKNTLPIYSVRGRTLGVHLVEGPLQLPRQRGDQRLKHLMLSLLDGRGVWLGGVALGSAVDGGDRAGCVGYGLGATSASNTWDRFGPLAGLPACRGIVHRRSQ